MSFETGSDNEKIDELQKQLDDIIDSQLNSVSGNDAVLIDATLGQRNDASGDAGGVRSNEPIIHNITEDDESGTPTGVFDRISLISSMIIVDHTSTPMDLRFIQGPAKDGSKIKITVKKDKVLVIKSGGNILTSADITITDEEFYILVKHSAAETGITGGAYKILKVGTAAGAGYDTIQEEGVSLTQRTIMNFIGATVTAVDNPGDSRTDITIVAGTAGLLSDLTIDVSKDWAGEAITNLGGITMSGDINVNTQDVINIDRAQFVQDSGALISVGNPTIYVNGLGAGDLVINNVDTEAIIFTHSNVIGLQDTNSTLRKSRVDGLPIFQIVREGTVPSAGSSIADIRGLFPRTTSGETLSSIISFTAQDTGNTTFEGGLAFQINKFSGQIIFMDFNDGKNDLIRIYKDFDFNSNDALKVDRLQFTQNTGALISTTDASIYVDGIGNGDLVINNVDTEAIIFTHSNVIGLQTTPTVLQKSGVDSNQFIRLVNTFSIPATGALGAFEISGVNDTPTQLTMAFFAGSVVQITSNGSGSAQIGVAIDGVQVDFIRVNDTDDGQTSFLSDVNFKDNFIQFTEIATPAFPAANDGRIYVRDDGGITTPFFLDSSGTETSMIDGGGPSNQIVAGDSNLTVVDGVGFTWVLDGGTIATMGAVEFLLGIDLDMDSDDILNPANITLSNGFNIENTNSTTTTFDIPNSEILLIQEGGDTRIQIDNNVILNADVSDDIIFREGGANVGRFDGGLDDWVFERDILLDGGTRIRSFDSTEIGIFVTNSTDSIGSAGTNQTPTELSISTSVANLDAAFGDGIGSWGVFNTSSSFINIAYKVLSNEWVVLALPDAGGTVISDHIN